MPKIPPLTLEQKRAALQKAQLMRSKRSDIRKKLKAGKMTLVDVLGRADEETIGRMRVTYLLQSLPKIGKVRSKKIMDEIGINESRRVQGLGSRQRDALIKKLG